ncbi:MAG: cyclase family protein [Candidatus Binatia bacterium]
MLRLLIAFALLLPLPAAALDIDPAKVVDLSYGFGPETVYWPTGKRFALEVVHKGESGGHWYEANNFCAPEHGGTHLDAPAHFAKGRASTDQVPVTAGIGPLVRIDVSAQAAQDRDYRLSVADLLHWEATHGGIPPGAIVVMYSGWGTRWPDAKRYLGTDQPGDVTNLHFPGFSKEAAQLLVNQRSINAIGVDTPSIDHGPSQDFVVHQIINGANKPAFENLANLDRVPAKGATIIALPMKIEGGSGGPLRAVAVLP